MINSLLARLPQDLLDKLKNCTQPITYHPEIHVLAHTEQLIDLALADRDLTCAIAGVFHDMGKIDTRRQVGDKITFYGHELISLDYVEKYWPLFAHFSAVGVEKETVRDLVHYHMRAHLYKSGKMSTLSKRQTFEQLHNFHLIIKFSDYDDLARKPA